MVKATVEQGDARENVRIVQVEVGPEKVKEYMDQAFNKLRHDIVVPGFRKGRIPRNLFERRFGEELLWHEAVEALVPDAYMEAISDLQLDPIAPPEIDLDEEFSSPQAGLKFSAQVEVVPQVKLGDYKDFDLSIESVSVTDEDVEEGIQNLRDNMATAVAVEDETAELAQGMMAIVSFQGYVDGEPVEALQGEDETVDVGQGRYLPGFEEGLMGAKVGETRSVTVEFPEEAGDPDLAGKEVTFEVEVLELKQKELPELNDAFAKQVSDVDTVEELREKMKTHLYDMRLNNTLRDFEDQVVAQLVQAAEVDLPEVMIQNLVERRWEDMKKDVESRGTEWDAFLAAQGEGYEATMTERLSRRSMEDLRETLTLEAVADQEDVQPEEADIEREMENRAMSMGMDAGILRQIAMTNAEFMERLHADCRLNKTRQLLAEWTDETYRSLREEMETRRQIMIEESRRRQQEAQEAAMAEVGQSTEAPETAESDDE